jgi:hypothetical protein
MTEADQEFIKWVETHNDWYERQSNVWRGWLTFCKGLTFVAAFASIIVSATTTAEFFGGWGRWLIVASTLASAFSSELLGQFQVRRMEELRENGNIETAHLVAYTRDKLDEFGDDRGKIQKLKDEVRNRIHALEQAQHRHFVSIHAGGHVESSASTVNPPVT